MKFIILGKSTLSINHMESNNNKTDAVKTLTQINVFVFLYWIQHSNLSIQLLSRFQNIKKSRWSFLAVQWVQFPSFSLFLCFFSMGFKLSNTIEVVPERKDYVFPVKKLLHSDLGTKAQR